MTTLRVEPVPGSTRLSYGFRCDNPGCDPKGDPADRAEREQRRANATSTGYEEEAADRNALSAKPSDEGPGEHEAADQDGPPGEVLSPEEIERMRRDGELGEEAARSPTGSDQGEESATPSDREGAGEGDGEGEAEPDEKGSPGDSAGEDSDPADTDNGNGEGDGEEEGNEHEEGASEEGEQEDEESSERQAPTKGETGDEEVPPGDPYEPPPPPPKNSKTGKPVRYYVGR